MKGLIIISVVFVGWLALDLLLHWWQGVCRRWDRDHPTLDDRRHW